MTTEPIASCFISYSHADKDLARSIHDGLVEHGYRVWLDEGELRIGDSLIEAISEAIDRVDFLVALVSEHSVNSSWCQREISLAMTGEINREGIQVLPCRVGGTTMPASLKDKLYLQISDDSDAVSTLHKAMTRHLAPAQPMPQLRRKQRPTSRRVPSPERIEPWKVRMLHVDTNSMTSPRMDGTPGSALYRVPIALSMVPDQLWADLFVRHWDRPPRWSTMHRPGIATVSGSQIVLDGTTVEEVEQHHQETLKLAVNAANRDRQEIAERLDREKVKAREKERQHREAAEAAAMRIQFNE